MATMSVLKKGCQYSPGVCRVTGIIIEHNSNCCFYLFQKGCILIIIIIIFFNFFSLNIYVSSSVLVYWLFGFLTIYIATLCLFWLILVVG